MPYIGNSPGTGTRNRFIYTATASQTTFSGADDNGKTLKYADSDYVDVYLNGICLVPVTDYTSTSKTSIVLTQAASLNDTLEVVAYDIATISDTVSKADGGTFDGNIKIATTSGPQLSIQDTDNGFDATTLQVENGGRDLDITVPQDIIFTSGSDEAMRILNSGRVGIGTGSSIDTKLHVENTSGTTLVKTEVASGSVVGYDIQKTGATTQHWRIADGVVANGQLEVYDQTNSKSMMAISTSGVVFNENGNDRDFRVESDSNDHAFAVDGAGYGTVKMGGSSVFNYNQTSGNGTFGYAIDNGSSYGSVIVSNNADRAWSPFYINKFQYSSGDDKRFIAFFVNGSSLANIECNAAGTALVYNTTSDRRLKENIQDITGGIDTVKQLRPRSFEWITQEDNTFPAHGFIADETDGIIPDAVTGEANAVDEDGNPIYQSMEYSKLVPVLTAALKEAIAKIETLETKVAALEAG